MPCLAVVNVIMGQSVNPAQVIAENLDNLRSVTAIVLVDRLIERGLIDDRKLPGDMLKLFMAYISAKGKQAEFLETQRDLALWIGREKEKLKPEADYAIGRDTEKLSGKTETSKQ